MNSTDNAGHLGILQVADLVYVDNPVGAGFSYVDEDSAFTTDVAQIGQDLLAWLRYFLIVHSEYRTRPFFIFCESYGGKMSAEFARVIAQEIASGTIRLDFRGVALGDSWISAMDYVNTWGEYLYANSLTSDSQSGVWLDSSGQNVRRKVVRINDSRPDHLGVTCRILLNWMFQENRGRIVSWYNILKYGGQDDWSKKRRKRAAYRSRNRQFNRHVAALQRDALSSYMDTTVRDKLGIIPDSVKFGGSPLFFGKLWTEMWMNRLTWPGMSSYKSARKTKLTTKSFPLAGFRKRYNNLSFYLILRAGHMVAYDTPEAAVAIVKQILADYGS
ncbi:serine carboxypeptidase [Ostertagia ostertagi]